MASPGCGLLAGATAAAGFYSGDERVPTSRAVPIAAVATVLLAATVDLPQDSPVPPPKEGE